MSRWLEYASGFEETIDAPYFKARSAYGTLESVKKSLYEKHGQMTFLLGSPGSGKTFLLNQLLKDETLANRPLLFDTPVLTPKSFLVRLLMHRDVEPQSDDIDRLKIEAQELYCGQKTLILIDEAQLLSDEMFEFLRILSDTRCFRIVFSMHETEGHAILQKPHFKSRPYKLVELGLLSSDEIELFISTQLKPTEDRQVLDFHDGHIKRIHKLTQGNFRYLKKLIYTEFVLLHEAQEAGLSKFQKPSKCLLNMAAIEIGILDV